MSQIDQFDERLIQLLGEDASQSAERLAKQLFASVTTTRRRLTRLLQSGALHIVAVPGPHAIGPVVLAMIAFKVDWDKIDGILETLGQEPRCRWVSATTGAFNVITIWRFRSNDDLFDFTRKVSANVPGIKGIETFICLHVEKSIYVRRTISGIDQVDGRLIELLSEDARQSHKRLATQAAVSVATVKRRLGRLLKNGALHMVVVPNPYEIGFPVVAVIALKVDPDKIDAILRRLGQERRYPWVSATTGRFDVLALAWFRSTHEFFDFVRGRIARIQGIKSIETFVCLCVKKSIWTAPPRLDRQG